jgi:hypothetical protein
MKLRTFFLVLGLIALVFTSCGDDDDGGNTIELRDPEEVSVENIEEIEAFLATHFYEVEDNPTNPNFRIFKFDTIAGDNSDKTPIADSPLLSDTTIIQRDVSYKLYYLTLRQGNLQERKPTFADSTLLTYQGITINNNLFDASPNPIWLDLTQTVRGFYELLPKLNGASGFVENSDGTINFNDDYGMGVVFIPSGLGYFASPPPGSGILRYQPIIFSVQLYKSREADHDRDGVPSYLEDFNNNGRVDEGASGDDLGDDLDRDGLPNYLDRNDDGDDVLTIDEITDDEGNIITPYPDSDNDGIPDYLDPDFPGDSI